MHDNSSASSNDEYCYGVHSKKTKTPFTVAKLDDVECRLMIDTGASVNILDENTYSQIGKPKLNKRDPIQLMPYGGGKPLTVMGRCAVMVETKRNIQCHEFHVVKDDNGTLLSCTTATELGLIEITNKVTDTTIFASHPNLFSGIGKLKNVKVELHIDQSVKPVALKQRRTPFHLREKVKDEIKHLLKQDIIEKVEGVPTPWVSPIVVTPKKNTNKIRVCVDMREPNKAIMRERHQMPTVDELINDLNGAKIFSKVDLRSGYHQLELDKNSRSITTFSTHVGLFRYKRLNFGVCSASEVFQKEIRNIVSDLEGVTNIADDILIYGSTQEKHDAALEALFRRLEDNGLTLNKQKCEFNRDKIEFFGIVFSAGGISPDEKKVEAIRATKPPTNISEARSLLGMMNFCARFISDYATVSEPIRRLTRKDTEWSWQNEQQTAFEKLTERLSENTTMAYYDPQKDSEIIVDASPVGLGAIFVQNGRVVSYASKALTDTESRYSQTEREALAVVWGCEHYDMYVRGSPHFTVITDHKALENIWQKERPPLRIERWSLRLQPYKFTIKYRPGKDNPADYMSRHPVENKTTDRQTVADEYVSFIAETSTPKAMTWHDVRTASIDDIAITKALQLVQNGRWFEIKNVPDSRMKQELKEIARVKYELTSHDGVLLCGTRIVLPTALRNKAVEIAHEGHQGIERTKSLIRSKLWFPRINEMVKNTVKACFACQVTNVEPKHMEPLKMSPMPETPWQNLSMDFCGPLSTGEYLLVIIDEHSRYPVVEIVPSVSANTVIPIVDKVLSTFGRPDVIKTDNGSPFNSTAFEKYAENSGFKHRRITPLWPRANAQAEAFNKPMMKAIRTAIVEKKSWKQELHKFLRQYRATPHPSTKYSPYRLLFGREPRTKLPQKSDVKSKKHVEVRAAKNDAHAKSMMKQYADQRNRAVTTNIKIGDTVLLRKDNKCEKSSTPFHTTPYEVINKKGNMVTCQAGGRNVTRNVTWFRKLVTRERRPNETHQQSDDDDDDDDRGNDDDRGDDDDDVNPPGRRDEPVQQRPKRTIRRPEKLRDYVTI